LTWRSLPRLISKGEMSGWQWTVTYQILTFLGGKDHF